jgi:16S rRNA U1498 N3-methylase RsmE
MPKVHRTMRDLMINKYGRDVVERLTELGTYKLLTEIEERIGRSARLTLMDIGYRGENLELMLKELRASGTLRIIPAKQKRDRASRKEWEQEMHDRLRRMNEPQ